MDQHSMGKAAGIAIGLFLVALIQAGALWLCRRHWPRGEFWLFSPMRVIVRQAWRQMRSRAGRPLA